jgi:hypothetical protein
LPDRAENEFVEHMAAAKPVEFAVEKPARKPRKRKEGKALVSALAT